MDKLIVKGERIQQIADIYLGNEDDFRYNPLIYQQKEKHCSLDSIVKEFENPSIVFCYSHKIFQFSQKIRFFKNEFILLTHNSDQNIKEYNEVNEILKYPKLIKWYTQNLCMEHPKLHYLPIGLANDQWPHGNLDIFKYEEVTKNLKNKSEKVYFNFNIHTNYHKRIECYESLKNKIHFLNPIPPFENLLRLKNYEFCICPEGNGMDTHRFWECIYLKVVPIVIDSDFIQILKKNNLPMLILKKWEDYDESKLKYNDFSFENLEIYISDFQKLNINKK
jgi:hypothetical protein